MTHTPAEDRYEKLSYTRTGRSGLQLPQFSFGLWQKFAEGYSFETQREILLHAFDLGITHFDNADRYGPPTRGAQRTFGKVLANDLAAHRDELVLSTKAGNPIHPQPHGKGGSRKSLLNSLDASLKDLGTDYVDIFYHHSPDLDVPLEETVSALAHAVKSGRALYVGISNYQPDRAREAAQLLRTEGVPLVIQQSRLNLFDRKIETNGLFDVATDEGFGLIVFSPLAQGLLTDKYLTGIPGDARAANSAFLPQDVIDDTYRERVVGLNAIALERGQTLPQLALQWVLSHQQVTSALIGASSTAQLDHNLAAVTFPDLTEAELAAIEEFAVDGTAARNR